MDILLVDLRDGCVQKTEMPSLMYWEPYLNCTLIKHKEDQIIQVQGSLTPVIIRITIESFECTTNF